jgi:hypothetical protein
MGDKMKCLICNKKFFIKRNLKDLLSEQKFLVCNDCYKKYEINISFNVIPLNNYKLYIYSLFEKEYIFKSDPYIYEFSRLFNYALTQSNKENILVYKNIHFNERKINQFKDISELIKDDLIIVCNSYTL